MISATPIPPIASATKASDAEPPVVGSVTPPLALLVVGPAMATTVVVVVAGFVVDVAGAVVVVTGSVVVVVVVVVVEVGGPTASEVVVVDTGTVVVVVLVVGATVVVDVVDVVVVVVVVEVVVLVVVVATPPHTNQWLIAGSCPPLVSGEIRFSQGGDAGSPRSPGTYKLVSSPPFTTIPVTERAGSTAVMFRIWPVLMEKVSADSGMTVPPVRLQSPIATLPRMNSARGSLGLPAKAGLAKPTPSATPNTSVAMVVFTAMPLSRCPFACANGPVPAAIQSSPFVRSQCPQRWSSSTPRRYCDHM
jgi:hypothetical protein